MTTKASGLRAVLAAAGIAAALLPPAPARAWWRGGGVFLGFNVPLYAGPPAYYPPSAYYPPPPVYAPAGQACYAGPYMCQTDRPTPIGGPCSCPTGHGRAFGRTG